MRAAKVTFWTLFYLGFTCVVTRGQYQGYVVKEAHSCRLTTDFYCAPHEGPITIHYGLQGYDFCHHTLCCPRSWDCVKLLTADDINIAKSRCDGQQTCRIAVSSGGPACHKGFGDYTNITYMCGGDPNLILHGPDINLNMGDGMENDGSNHVNNVPEDNGISDVGIDVNSAAEDYGISNGERKPVVAFLKQEDPLWNDDSKEWDWDDWDDDLEPGQIAAIVIGVLVVVGIIVGVVVFVVLRKRRRQKEEEQQAIPRPLSPGAAEINRAMTNSERGSRPPSRMSVTSSSGSAPILFETSLTGEGKTSSSSSMKRKEATSIHTQADMLLANGFSPPKKYPPLQPHINGRPGGPQGGPPRGRPGPPRENYPPSRGSSTSGYASSSMGYGYPPGPENRPPIPVPRGEMPHQGHRMGLKLYDTPISVHMNSPTSPDAPDGPGSSSTIYEQIVDSPNSMYDELNERTINYNQRHTIAGADQVGYNNRNSTVRFSDTPPRAKPQPSNPRHTTAAVPTDTTYHYNQPPPSRPQSQVTTPSNGSALPPGKSPHEMIMEESETESIAGSGIAQNQSQEYLAPYVMMNPNGPGHQTTI